MESTRHIAEDWLAHELVMFKQKILFGSAIVGVFRAYMFERRQPHRLPFAKFQILDWQGRKSQIAHRHKVCYMAHCVR